MRTIALSILLAAGAALAFPANAQTPPAPASPPDPSFPTSLMGAQPPAEPPWSEDLRMPCCDATDTRRARSFGSGVAALEASDFTRAEEIFADILRYNKNDTTLRYHMGVAKMNLGKWDEAKRYLRTPARELRKDPDPKSLLGVTYARLGDIAGANAQRASLVRMAEACKGACEFSSSIMDGIRMIDEALAETRSSSP
jgi:Flp pilus assembly protein TadD